MGKREDEGHDEDIHQSDLEEKDPAEPHQLVVTKAGQSESDPDKEKQQRGDLGKKRHNVKQAAENTPPSWRRSIDHGPVKPAAPGWYRQMPAAEKERYDHRRAGDHGRVFTEEEESKFHRTVFGVITADQLLLRF